MPTSTTPARTIRPRRGFSLAESIIAIGLTSMAGTGLLLALASSLQSTTNATDRAIAAGMADQLMDEIMGCRYSAAGAGAYQIPLCPNSYEMAGSGRERYDDTDDYTGFIAQPAKDQYGIELGQGDDVGGLRHPNFRLPSGTFSNWRQEIDVYYVSESNPSVKLTGSNTSNMRAVEVRIYRQDGNRGKELLKQARRVYAYVPSPQ
jgi:hypothetical protein